MNYRGLKVNFEDLLGKTIIKIDGMKEQSNYVSFETDNGEVFEMLHHQDCCEIVSIYDINGDFNDLINTPITFAQKCTSNDTPSDIKNKPYDSFTWTFYKLGTIKGFVDIRWLGESNGYYGEEVTFQKKGGAK